MSTAYEEMLRADRAELALKDAQEKLARLLEMADAWDQRWGDGGIKASIAATAIRRAVRGLEFTP